MTAYNEKLYEFITEEENFLPFIELKEQYEIVRKKLLTDFWKEVEVELKKYKKSKWEVWLDDDVMKEYSKLGFYHKDYYREKDESRSFGIIFEHLTDSVLYGLWFNRTANLQNLNFNSVCNDIKHLHVTWKAGTSAWWFAARNETGDNFDNSSDLVKILPKNREAVVKEYASLLISALEELFNTGMKYAKKL